MDDTWDAIIIGGGPAGSTVAKYAAEGGAKVLVIDRRKEIGTPLYWATTVCEAVICCIFRNRFSLAHKYFTIILKQI